jgi:hypothetical protein
MIMNKLSEAASQLGKKGGKARAEALSPERRKEISTKATQERWRLYRERKQNETANTNNNL